MAPEADETHPPGNKGPSAASAAQMFLDLSQEYLEVVPDRRGAYSYAFGARTSEQRAALRDAILAVVLQRKFVTPRENTYLPGLLRRIYEEHKNEIPRGAAPPISRVPTCSAPGARGDRRSGKAPGRHGRQ